MSFSDFHVHSTFSDGKSTPEDIVSYAVEKKMRAVGFSDHSHTPFDTGYCLASGKEGEYQKAIRDLKVKYRDQMTVLCGVEQDFYSTTPTDAYDYVIGSVHYILIEGEYVSVDNTPQILLRAAEKHFGGDLMAVAELYFQNVKNVVEKTGADLIGHFDLISKFNEGNRLFDENHPRYKNAALDAIEALLKTKKPFEINTGAISRGYRSTPYPARIWMEVIREGGGKFVLSGDSHSKENLCFHFEDWKDWGSDFLEILSR